MSSAYCDHLVKEGISMTQKIKNILIIILLFLGITLIFLLTLLSRRVTRVPEDAIGNTAGNLLNGGLFCEDEGIVYFANAYDNHTLYSMNPDESEIKKISNVPVSSINAAGKYLFYYQNASASTTDFTSFFRIDGVYRATKDGRKSTCLKRVPSPCLSLYGNTVFYQNYNTKKGTSLCRIDIDRQNDKEILPAHDSSNPSCIYQGSIYFGGTKKDHYLYRLDTESDTVSTAWDGNLYSPIIQDDWVYYMDISGNYRLCRYHLYDQSVQILTEDRLDFFNVTGEWIYYQKSDQNEPALKRITIDGQKEEIVAEGVYQHINATSRYVYFNAYDQPTPVYHTPVNGPVMVGTFNAVPLS